MGDIHGRLFVYSILFLAVGIWFTYWGLSDYLLIQKMKNTPTSRISSAPLGSVELSGKARSIEHQISPISGDKCVFWRVTAEYNAGKGRYRTIFSAKSDNNFYIEDNTGKSLIESKGAEIDIPRDNLYKGCINEHRSFLFGPSHQLDDRVMNYISSLDQKIRKSFSKLEDIEIHFSEYFIAENDPLFVLGTAAPYEDTQKKEDDNVELVIGKGTYDKTLYISDSGETTALNKKSALINAKIYGGLVLSAMALFMILITFEMVADAWNLIKSTAVCFFFVGIIIIIIILTGKFK